MSRTNVLMVAILCFILGANIGLAQGMYLAANAGYGFGAATQFLGTNTTYTGTGTPTSFEGVFGSYGGGFKVGASAGYMFNKNLGAELGLSYWLGKTFEAGYNSTTNTQTSKLSGSGFVAVPSIVVVANMEKVIPYARFGLVLGILKVKQENRFEQPGNTMQSTLEESGSLAFGYAGALGILVPGGGTVDFFAEVDLHSVNFSPSQIEVTKYTLNGVDQLASIDHKTIEYKESHTESDLYTQMAVREPFSSIGIVVGARINL
jgi:hypothetical protein